MHILLIGLDHKRTPLEAREGVSFSKEQLPQALSLLKEHVGEVGILTTSNHTEIYSVTNDPVKAAVRIRRFMTDLFSSARHVPSMHMYDYVDADAVNHLFRVASGLDSIIIGESKILSQIRDALSSANGSQSAHVSLVSLLRAALRVGRRVLEETNVEQNALSISYAGAEENLEERKRTDIDAEAIVRDELEMFMRDWDSLEAAVVIETLRQKAEEIRKRELVRAFKKLSNLPPQHLDVVDTLTQSIVNKLLQNPTSTLKRRENRPQLQAVRNLFHL